MRPPGPNQLKMLAALPMLLGDRLGWMMSLEKTYGDVVRLPFGPRVSYALFLPEHYAQVFVTNGKAHWKGRTFQKTAAYLGNGLATSEGAFWQRQRRSLNPHFTREALSGLGGIMVDNIDAMLERWRGRVKRGETIDFAFEFQRLAMGVVARALFGMSVPEGKVATIIECIKEALSFTTARTMNPFDIQESWPLPANVRYRRAVEKLDAAVLEFIRAERVRPEPGTTLLSMLVNAQDPETGEAMTDRQIRDEVMTMFLGGTDTSGNTLSWVCYYLDRLPGIRAKVLEEIGREIGSRRPTAADFMRLSYLRRVIDETLRLSPQNWVMSRDSLERQDIGGYTIPAGSTIFMGVYVTHRRPDIWGEAAEEFDPDRFLPERSNGRHPLAYLPFGAGQRKCIGFHFAQMEIVFAVTRILQAFRYQLVEPERIKPKPTWSLWPDPGVRARLEAC